MTDAPQKGRKTDEAQEAATQKLLAGLGDQMAQARYGQVAPAFNPGGEKPKGRDPNYVGPPEGGRTKGTYGTDGTLVPGSGQPQTDGQPPKFTDIHRDQQIKPGESYTPSIEGQTVQNQLNGKGKTTGRHYSWEGADFFDSRVQETIISRGQHRDLLNSTIFAGAASVPIPLIHSGISRSADRAVAKAAETGVENNFSKMGKWWQTNVDPTKANAGDLIKVDPKHTAAFENFDGLQTKLTEAAKGEGELAAKANEKLEFLKARTADGKFSPQNWMEASAKDGGKFFTQDELLILEQRANAGKLVDAAAKKESGRIAQALENMPGWMSRMGNGMLGSAMQYGIVSADRSMTQSVAGKDGLHESWNASQFLGPMALAALPGKYKLLAPVIAIGGSQAIDGLARTTGLTAPDRVNAATGVYDGWNGAFVAGSLTLATYAKNPMAKALIAGTGVIAPILVHAYQDNIGGNLKGGVDDVRNSFDHDHTKRSYSSLKDVDSSFEKVLNKKEDWVVANVDASFAAMNSRWNAPADRGGLTKEQKLLGLRDDASATGALSHSILDKGTRISDKGTEPQYMLQGYELDAGGRALHYMLRERNSAVKGAALTEEIIRDNAADPNHATTIKGELPTQKEADDLRKFAAESQTDITKILDGKHDIRGAYDELVHKAEVLDKEFLKTYIKGPDRLILYYNDKAAKAQAAAQKAATDGNEPLRQEAELKTQEYAKVVAKLYRDQALAYMAMAEAKMKNGDDGGGAYDFLIDDGTNHKDIFESGQKKGYNGAQGTLRIADSYAPNNPDTQQLGEIFSGLVTKMQEKKRIQIQSSSTNILGYHDSFTRPAQ